MGQRLERLQFDVIVIGGGSAGIAAAISAARNGARTLIVEAGPMLGGELISGIAMDGAVNGRGEWIVGGPARSIFDQCDKMGGYIGPVNDWRLIHYVSFDPEVMKLAVASVVADAGVVTLLHSIAVDVVMEGNRITGVTILSRGRTLFAEAKIFIDCSGDADLVHKAGAPVVLGKDESEFQPVSLIFRMSDVDNAGLLDFVGKHPENLALGESEAMRGGRTDAECAAEIVRQGEPAVFFKAEGPLMGDAIRNGELFPTALIMISPTSRQRREVALNATRVANIDATRSDALSNSMPSLVAQVWNCVEFLKKRVPGFENANFSGVASRIGIRETRRVVGDYVLSTEDVLEGRKSDLGVAKGCHHVDIHGDGTIQVRIPVADGGSYDIPFGCLVPQKLENVLVAGRCLSATREAQGSARVMGGCMGMGQAVGTAAALSVSANWSAGDIRNLPVERLRSVIREQGGVVEGTH